MADYSKPLATSLATLTGRWEPQPLAELVESLFVGLPVSRYSAKSGERSIQAPVLSVSDIDDGRVSRLEEISRIELRDGNYERFRVRSEDILVSCRGTLLKMARVPHEASGALASSSIITVRAKNAVILPQILLAVLKSSAWQETLKSRTRSATGLMQLTIKDLQDLPIPVPPYKLQVKLAKLVVAAERAHCSAIDAANMRRALVESFVTHALLDLAPGRPS